MLETKLKPISPIPFVDLKSQQKGIRAQIDIAIKKVLDHGQFIMGPEVFELEKQLAAFCGVKHAISCANGTDALILGLMAKNVNAKHAIFVPSFTFAATAEVVALMNATPIFIDVLPDTYNMDPASLEKGIHTAKKLGLIPYGIIPVDLFGQPADYDAIQVIADAHKLWVMADCAQSFGATYKGRKAGNMGDMATTSFFPAKPFGCYGDGGAIFTNDDELAELIKSMRIHGQGADKYDNVRIGINGRLDTIQAAILIEKLKIFSAEIIARQDIARLYTDGLKNIVKTPKVIPDTTSIWALYTVRLPAHIDRTELMAYLKEAGIPSVIYYVKPVHQSKAYEHYPVASEKGLPVTEMLAKEVLSLPMSAYVSAEQIQYLIKSFNNFAMKLTPVSN